MKQAHKQIEIKDREIEQLREADASQTSKIRKLETEKADLEQKTAAVEMDTTKIENRANLDPAQLDRVLIDAVASSNSLAQSLSVEPAFVTFRGYPPKVILVESPVTA